MVRFIFFAALLVGILTFAAVESHEHSENHHHHKHHKNFYKVVSQKSKYNLGGCYKKPRGDGILLEEKWVETILKDFKW